MSGRQTNFPTKWNILGSVALLAFVTGCFGGNGYPKTAPVKGVITYKGKPLADANVSFIPSGGRPASGTTNSNGEFELTTFVQGDGALPGEHHVLVQKFTQPASDELYAEVKTAIPKKYSEIKTSPLRESISKEGNVDLRIELLD
ncbi:hypothetical protein [Bremerella sp. P1]|uniref:hypothetical protein n=1 Tax=Bremerella sp. P1 TaxID=3026424 RepID=UPI002368D4D3|nr:hypothetical protein [Bremerella sp. P1]WDI41619.1 hypothetical protein PSR63_24465 [Bremerella sp. P1]